MTFDVGWPNALYLMFTNSAWVDRLSRLKAGDQLTVRGQIEKVDRLDIQLTDCELVEG
jgi:hypothetical protein